MCSLAEKHAAVAAASALLLIKNLDNPLLSPSPTTEEFSTPMQTPTAEATPTTEAAPKPKNKKNKKKKKAQSSVDEAFSGQMKEIEEVRAGKKLHPYYASLEAELAHKAAEGAKDGAEDAEKKACTRVEALRDLTLC